MATFSSFSASATLNFAATESFTNGPIICFNGTVTATSSLSASNGGRYVIWGVENSGLTGYNYLTLITSSITGSNLNTFIAISAQVGVDFGAYCNDVINTYVEGQNLYDLFESHNIILSQSFLYPTITVSPVTMSFGNVYSNTSLIGAFSVQGVNLLANLIISSSNTSSFQISTDGDNFFNSVTLSPYDGVINSTLYTQFIPNYILGGFSGSVVFSSSVASASAFVTGSGIQEPLIYTDFTGFTSNFGDIPVNISSSQQQFIVSGSYLVDDIEIVAGTGFFVSFTSGSSYSSSLTITQSGGSASMTSIYAIFYPTESGDYVNTINITSQYADSISQLVQGTSATASLYVDPLLIDFGAVPNGGQSTDFEFVISASYSEYDAIITPSTEVLVSLTSGSGYSNSPLTITQSAYVIPPITIHTILEPITLPVGDYTGTISVDINTTITDITTTGSVI
jgi:hypothetical protein